jgi:hypothetical protein
MMSRASADDTQQGPKHSPAAKAYARERIPIGNVAVVAMDAFDAGAASVAPPPGPVRIGAGRVRVGDVLDVTHRVTVTGVGDECDVRTDDTQSSHNLHASNVTAYLVSRPPTPDADALHAIAETLTMIGIDVEDADDDAPVILANLRGLGLIK